MDILRRSYPQDGFARCSSLSFARFIYSSFIFLRIAAHFSIAWNIHEEREISMYKIKPNYTSSVMVLLTVQNITHTANTAYDTFTF